MFATDILPRRSRRVLFYSPGALRLSDDFFPPLREFNVSGFSWLEESWRPDRKGLSPREREIALRYTSRQFPGETRHHQPVRSTRRSTRDEQFAHVRREHGGLEQASAGARRGQRSRDSRPRRAAMPGHRRRVHDAEAAAELHSVAEEVIVGDLNDPATLADSLPNSTSCSRATCSSTCSIHRPC